MELRINNGRSHDLLEHSIVFILKLLAGSAVRSPQHISVPRHQK